MNFCAILLPILFLKVNSLCLGGGQVYGKQGPYKISDYDNLLTLEQAMKDNKFSLVNLEMSLNFYVTFQQQKINGTQMNFVEEAELFMHAFPNEHNQLMPTVVKSYYGLSHGFEQDDEELYKPHSMKSKSVTRIYFDEEAKLAGFQLFDRSTFKTSYIGSQQADEIWINVENELAYSPATQIVGFLTTKACRDDKKIQSIQLIYLSQDDVICQNYLSVLPEYKPTDQPDEECPLEPAIQSQQGNFPVNQVFDNISGWTNNQAWPENYKKRPTLQDLEDKQSRGISDLEYQAFHGVESEPYYQQKEMPDVPDVRDVTKGHKLELILYIILVLVITLILGYIVCRYGNGRTGPDTNEQSEARDAEQQENDARQTSSTAKKLTSLQASEVKQQVEMQDKNSNDQQIEDLSINQIEVSTNVLKPQAPIADEEEIQDQRI